MGLAFITWLWGDKYDEGDVGKLAFGVRRNYRAGKHRFVVFSDRALKLPPPIEVKPIADPDLIGAPCFCRLRMFDPEWQRQHGFNGTIVSLDLDLVICGVVDQIFNRVETFVILQGVNAVNPNPFNCSVMMLKAGHHAEVWQDFTLAKAATIPCHDYPDDQAWVFHKLPKAAGWKPGQQSGVYGFQKPGWPYWVGKDLPPNARIIAFIGWRKPANFGGIPWVQANWRLAFD